MAKAEDMGGFFRIPADNRNLNYSQYFSEGKDILPEIQVYNSHNTTQLDVEGVKNLLLTLEEFK